MSDHSLTAPAAVAMTPARSAIFERIRPYFWFVCICLIWAGSFILMKKAMLAWSSIAVGTGRVLFGSLTLAIVWGLSRAAVTLRRKDWPLVGFIVLIGFCWPYSIQPYLVSRCGSAFIGITVGFAPLLTMLISWLVLGNAPSRRQGVGVIGALLCLIALMFDGWQRSLPIEDLLLSVTVPLGYSLANILIRRHLGHVASLELTFICLAASLFVLGPWAVAYPGDKVVTPAVWWQASASAFVLGALGTGIANWQFTQLVQQQGPLFAAMVTNLVPLGALVWGVLDGESISNWQVICLFGVLTMVTYVQWGAAHPASEQKLPDHPEDAT